MRDTRKQTGGGASGGCMIVGIFGEIFRCLQDREKGLSRSHIELLEENIMSDSVERDDCVLFAVN
jgi:hypothetical protein